MEEPGAKRLRTKRTPEEWLNLKYHEVLELRDDNFLSWAEAVLQSEGADADEITNAKAVLQKEKVSGRSLNRESMTVALLRDWGIPGGVGMHLIEKFKELKEVAHPSTLAAAQAASNVPVVVDPYAQAGLEPQHIPASRRKFSTNGAIRYAESRRIFYVDPKHDNEESLLPKIRDGGYVLLHGPRASGKSTKMYRACEQLGREYFVMNVSLEQVSVGTKAGFWQALWARLRELWTHLPSAGTTESDFIGLFAPENKKRLFDDKSVVLFIDEFDTIDGSADVRESMLHTLRGLKERKVGQNCLHSVVALGPFSILKLNTLTASPFNASDCLHVKLMDHGQVRELFKQLADERKGTIPDHELEELIDAIAMDVYERCAGHPGLVVWCFKAFDEKVAGVAWVSCPQYATWERFLAMDLENRLITWPTMARMVSILREPSQMGMQTSKKIEEARSLLCNRFLTTQCLAMDANMDKALVDFLIAEGALVKNEHDNSYDVRNGIVRALLLLTVLPCEKHSRPRDAFPCRGGKLNVAMMLEGALKAFDKNLIREAHDIASKGFRHGERRVPNEYTYHHQLTAVLHAWVCKGISIGVEVNAQRMRADVVLFGKGLDGKVVLEIMASGTDEQVKEHCERAELYKATLDAKRAVVLHFVAQWPAPAEGSALQLDHLIHIYHDTAMENFQIVTSPSFVPEV